MQVADSKAGALLLEPLPTCRINLADKGYDSDPIRGPIEATGAAPNGPPKVNRRWSRAVRPCSIVAGTRSCTRSGGTRIFVASPPAMIGSPATTSLPSASRRRLLLVMSPDGRASRREGLRSAGTGRGEHSIYKPL